MEGGLEMKIYGSRVDDEESVQLKEVIFNCNVEEIQELITFLEIVKERHESYLKTDGECHTHYRDWNKEWEIDLPDIVVTTISDNN